MSDVEHAALSERITKLDGKVDLLLQSTTELNKAMTVVVRLEARHEFIGKELAALESATSNADMRLKVIESAVPGLLKLEAQITWIQRIVIGAVITSLLWLILTKTPGG
jgi:hypothetical protein